MYALYRIRHTQRGTSLIQRGGLNLRQYNIKVYYSHIVLLSQVFKLQFITFKLISIIYFNLACLKALIGVFYQHHSLNYSYLITYCCMLASIKYLDPDYFHNYPIIIKLCFSAHPIIPELFLLKCQPIILQNYASILGSSLTSLWILLN